MTSHPLDPIRMLYDSRVRELLRGPQNRLASLACGLRPPDTLGPAFPPLTALCSRSCGRRKVADVP